MTTHWPTDPDAGVHLGGVDGCERCKPEVRHGATVMSSARHGCWATCLCGWKSELMTTSGGASVAFAEHVANQGEQ